MRLYIHGINYHIFVLNVGRVRGLEKDGIAGENRERLGAYKRQRTLAYLRGVTFG